MTIKSNIFKKNYIFLFLLTAIPLLFLPGCESRKETIQTKTAFRFDTVVQISYYDEKDEDAVDQVIARLADYENIFSRTGKESELHSVNMRLGKDIRIEISKELYDCLSAALSVAEKTGGAFDITLGNVSDLWNFTGENPSVPEEAKLKEALSHTGYQKLHLFEKDSRYYLFSDDPNLSIDLGGIAKGYISGLARDELIRLGVRRFLLNFGGNIVVSGGDASGDPVPVGVQKPEKGAVMSMKTYELTDGCLVTSGVYQRCFTENGKRYHHILDPKTGYPVENGLLSVSVRSNDPTLSDAYSTALFVLGPDAEKPEAIETALYIDKAMNLIEK